MSDPACSTTAVVLTHRRPRLAGSLVRSLLALEGLPPRRIIVVVDRDGGLDDPALEAAVRVVRLDSNRGPAAGFRIGMAEAFADRSTDYAYLCEDDVELSGLPMPRLSGLVAAVSEHETSSGELVGAVVAYGRKFDRRRNGTAVVLRPQVTGPRLQAVDVAPWGATLVSRHVHEAGVAPDDHWFFGYEDFDFFLRVAGAGLSVLVDRDSALVAHEGVPDPEPDGGAATRPDAATEPWRAFYVARNFFELARRHGDLRWTAWHLALTVRRFQLAPDPATRRAVVAGLLHGLARHGGRHDRYVRDVGEL